MKKIFYFIGFMLFFLSCGKSQNYPAVQYGKLGKLSGAILKEIKKNNEPYLSFAYDDKNRIIKTILYYQNPDGTSHTQEETYEYNNTNQIVKRNYFSTMTDYYEYENGKLKSVRTVNSNNAEYIYLLTFEYENGRINRATSFFNDKESSYILYEYDARGNTTSRKTYTGNGKDAVLYAEYRCTYDDKINPVQLLSQYPLDMIQKNNVTSGYHYSIVMSSLPFITTFKYDYYQNNLPKEVRTQADKYSNIKDVLTYVYETSK